MVEPVEAPSERTGTQKTLDEYAKAILEAHQSVEYADGLSKKHGREAIAAAHEAGQYLNSLKGLLGHGNWLKWLKDNCKGISEKTAQRYMVLAKSDIVSVLKHCSNLRQAYIFTGAIKAAPVDRNPDELPVT